MKLEFGPHVYNISEYPQYTAIEHNKELQCTCGHCNEMNHNSIIRGYCSTSVGYMIVFECSKCGDIYRHHINTTGRYNIEEFKRDVGLMLHFRTK